MLLANPFLPPIFVFVGLCLLLPRAARSLNLPPITWLLGPLLQLGICFGFYYLADVLRPDGLAGSPPNGDHYGQALIGTALLSGPYVLPALVLGAAVDLLRERGTGSKTGG